MPNETILLVDDEPFIIQLARMYLERDGFQVQPISDGRAALQAAQQGSAALMVLDVMLPGVDGFEVCRLLRAQGNPISILMLTARDEDIDKIIGLELGADDYMTKPFNPRELVARVKAILRRQERAVARTVNEPSPTNMLRLGSLTIDTAGREVHLGGDLVDLRAQEYDLLMVLVENRGRVLSREKLLELAWGFDFFGQTRTVDVHIGHLRRKLSGSGVQIETVTGIGYKLVA
jgi:two-component system, OmpR family, alkaline phosphatase synthesis response regulator PhoP